MASNAATSAASATVSTGNQPRTARTAAWASSRSCRGSLRSVSRAWTTRRGDLTDGPVAGSAACRHLGEFRQGAGHCVDSDAGHGVNSGGRVVAEPRAAPPTTRDHCKRSRRRRSHLPRRAPSAASQWATLQCCPPGPAQRRSRRTAPGLRPPREMMAVSVWGPPIACGSGRDSIQSASSFPSPRALARRNRGLPFVDARLSSRTPPRARRRASRSGGGSTASCVVVWVFVVIAGRALQRKTAPLLNTT